MRTVQAAPAAFVPKQASAAVTAGDFLDRLNADQRRAFIEGALEMLTQELALAGQRENAVSVMKWYFEGDGPRQVVAVFGNHRDLPAAAIVRTLARRVCQQQPR